MRRTIQGTNPVMAVLAAIGIVAILILALPLIADWVDDRTDHIASADDNITTQTGGGGATTSQAACEERPLPASQDIIEIEPGCNVKGDIWAGPTRDSVKKLHDDNEKTGLIVSCPNGCFVKAEHGANVTPRTVPDLESEMKDSGCGITGGCETVDKQVVNRDAPDGGKPSAGDGTVPGQKSTEDLLADCDLSLRPTDPPIRVPKGCIVMGDVQVASSQGGSFAPLYDNNPKTGLIVNVVSDNVWVRAPFGASVNDSTPAEAEASMKMVGCGLADGCVAVKIVDK